MINYIYYKKSLIIILCFFACSCYKKNMDAEYAKKYLFLEGIVKLLVDVPGNEWPLKDGLLLKMGDTLNKENGSYVVDAWSLKGWYITEKTDDLSPTDPYLWYIFGKDEAMIVLYRKHKIGETNPKVDNFEDRERIQEFKMKHTGVLLWNK